MMEIGKRISLATAGTSFDDELRALLAQRSKLAYGVAFVVSALAFLFYRLVVDKQPVMAQTPLVDWHKLVYFLYPIAFGLTTVALLTVRWSANQLILLDYAVMAFALLLSHFTAAVFLPLEVPLFAVALILFTHAAIIPARVACQTSLAVTAAVGYPLEMLLAYAFLPGIEEFWAQHGGAAAFRATVLEGTFTVGITAAVSVVVTQALYGMRVSLHQAKRLGNYIIKEELGRGGMGQVHVAEHALMCRPTAVKVMGTNGEGSSTDLARFEREVRLSATLTHPNTITIYDFGRTPDNTFYYAMEYLDGLDLEALVERFGPIAPERAVYILKQVCGSLAEAHAREIVHRDIKPSNVFLTHRGGLYDFVKVLDFGLAKQLAADEATALTKSGVLFGTPRYLAPETVYGADKVDARADIYNVGGVAYWMVTGQPPFAKSSSVEVIIDHVKTVPPRPSEISEMRIPAELDDIIMRCLEKKPADRYETACELEDVLGTISFESPWTQRAAREWWSLHAPDDARIARCYSAAEEGASLSEIAQPQPAR